MIDILHHHDHASVLLDGDLDWPRTHNLLHAIESAVDHYQYGLVEIRIRSRGGSNEPLEYLLECLRTWREKGVRFRTRALGRTSSAPALLLALGDERTADSQVNLRFHGASMYRRGDVNAEESAAINTRLTRDNEAMIGWLVERALAGTCSDREHGAEEADREVLEGLCLGAAPDPAATPPTRIRTLATALGQTVDDAIGKHDTKSLSHLYRRLFQLDRPISGKLARSLRLVDRVAETGQASPHASSIPISPAPRPTPFASPAGEIGRETLLRHVLVLGDDRSSVTHLCLAPLVAALARAPRSQVGPVLVLDPGPELHSALRCVARDRIFALEPDSLVFDLMPASRSLGPVLDSGHWMSGAAKVLERTLAFLPGSPARFLRDDSGRVVDPVVRDGTNLARSVLGFVLMVTSQDNPQAEDRHLDEDRPGWLPATIIERAHGRDGERGPNVLALTAWILDTEIRHVSARVAGAATRASGSGGCEEGDLARGLRDGAEALSSAGDYAHGVLSVARTIVRPFATALAARALYVGCEPALESAEALDIPALISGDTPRFIVYEPRQDGSDHLTAMALKQLFLESVLDIPGWAPAGAEAPLRGYIARDVERFATDVDFAFLDRARLAGAFAVLTSRSVSAIEHGFRGVPGRDALFSHLWSAAGSKLVLRSTDPRTQELTRGLAPRRPALPEVLDVRPLSGLAPDECYVIGVDGRFERRRLATWTDPGPEHVDPRSPHRGVEFVTPTIWARRQGST